MADIFISYASEDRAMAEQLARELAQHGYDVWWDNRLLAGDNYAAVIANMINKARAVIVVWTSTSIKSQWVYSEAKRATDGNKLISTLNDQIRPESIPPPFDALHVENISNIGNLIRALVARGIDANDENRTDRTSDAAVERILKDKRGAGPSIRLDQIDTGAVKFHEDALSRFPNHPRLLSALGRAHQAAGNDHAAFNYFKKAVDSNDAWGKVLLAGLFSTGQVVTQSASKAEELLLSAVQDGFTGAYAELGDLYNESRLYNDSWTGNQEKALFFYNEGAGQGDPASMAALGLAFEYGDGVEEDQYAAREWYEKAAKSGHSLAMTRIGECYRDGVGTVIDISKAIMWFRSAIVNGEPSGYTCMGELYYAGTGVDQNLTKARECYANAAAGGDGDGMLNLAIMLDEGEGGSVDCVSAAHWLMKAPLAGNDDADEHLMTMECWDPGTRLEIKKRLAATGHFRGKLNERWTDAARIAFENWWSDLSSR
jgi:TPR repeat protein